MQGKARRPWSPSELVRVQCCPQLGASMGLSGPTRPGGRPAHLAPAFHLELHLPFSSCLPLVCMPRLRSHLVSGQAPAGLWHPFAPFTLGGHVQSHDCRAELELRPHFQCPLLFPWSCQTPWQSFRRKGLCGRRDLMHTPSRADLNPFLPRTAAQT